MSLWFIALLVFSIMGVIIGLALSLFYKERNYLKVVSVALAISVVLSLLTVMVGANDLVQANAQLEQKLQLLEQAKK